MTVKMYSVIIGSEEDVVSVRRHAREIAGLLGFDGNDQTRIATAVSEIARNAHNYGRGGMAEFLFDPAASTYTVRIQDKGPGIANLKKILVGDYKSNTGMGLGIMGARRLMDEFEIQSKPGATVVSLGKRLPAHVPKLTQQRLAKIQAELSQAIPRNVMDELRVENRELMRAMEEVVARQEDLARLNAELEDTNRGVVALYAELDEKAERLRHADQMKSRFLSHMSHEFRTPLTSIMALSRLLLDETDGELAAEQQKQVSFIRKSAENLLEMVNDLLDLARVEAGKSIVHPAPFEVTNLLGGLRGVLRPLQINESVELVFDEPAGIPTLNTDEAKIAQILRNFISNALKFTEHGEVRVSARLSPDGASAIFSVTDTGIGIAPAHLEMIFNEFAQVDTPIQRKFKGTGLGLPLAKGLAELLGGRAYVESVLGAGSTFSAEIPLIYRGSEAEQPAPMPGSDFLLIDDEELSRYLIRQSLGASANLMEAPNGPAGIELAKTLKPRAILLDLRMPGMSGFDVLRELKSESATRDIPVVIMTSKVLDAREREMLARQASAILSKEVLSQPDAGERIRAAAKVEKLSVS